MAHKHTEGFPEGQEVSSLFQITRHLAFKLCLNLHVILPVGKIIISLQHYASD